MLDSLPADHDDHYGRAYGYAPDRLRFRRRRRFAATVGPRRCRRPRLFASRYLVFDACFLHLYGPFPNMGREPFREIGSKTELLSCGRTFFSRLITSDRPASRNSCLQFCLALLTFSTVFFSVVAY